jgi:hypothetical protein
VQEKDPASDGNQGVHDRDGRQCGGEIAGAVGALDEQEADRREQHDPGAGEQHRPGRGRPVMRCQQDPGQRRGGTEAEPRPRREQHRPRSPGDQPGHRGGHSCHGASGHRQSGDGLGVDHTGARAIGQRAQQGAEAGHHQQGRDDLAGSHPVSTQRRSQRNGEHQAGHPQGLHQCQRALRQGEQVQAGAESGRGDPREPHRAVGQLPQQSGVGHPAGGRAGGLVLLQGRGHGEGEGTGQRREHRLDHHDDHHPLDPAAAGVAQPHRGHPYTM